MNETYPAAVRAAARRYAETGTTDDLIAAGQAMLDADFAMSVSIDDNGKILCTIFPPGGNGMVIAKWRDEPEERIAYLPGKEPVEPPASSLPTPEPDEVETERAIQAAGLTAPRVTPADLDREILAGSITYFTAAEGVTGGLALDQLERNNECWSSIRLAALHPLQRTTFCVITLNNRFSVTGQSACVDPANFNWQIGRDIAYRNARRQLWPLLGFRLADMLLRAKTMTKAGTPTVVGRVDGKHALISESSDAMHVFGSDKIIALEGDAQTLEHDGIAGDDPVRYLSQPSDGMTGHDHDHVRGFGQRATTVIKVVPARHGNELTYFQIGSDEPLTLASLDLMHIAAQLAGIAGRLKGPVEFVVDATGMGAMIVDRLRQLGYTAKEYMPGSKENYGKPLIVRPGDGIKIHETGFLTSNHNAVLVVEAKLQCGCVFSHRVCNTNALTSSGFTVGADNVGIDLASIPKFISHAADTLSYWASVRLPQHQCPPKETTP